MVYSQYVAIEENPCLQRQGTQLSGVALSLFSWSQWSPFMVGYHRHIHHCGGFRHIVVGDRRHFVYSGSHRHRVHTVLGGQDFSLERCVGFLG